MEHTFPTPADDGALQAGIREMLAQMKAIQAEIERDQAETDRLKRETAVLKSEGAALKVETRAVLATLDERGLVLHRLRGGRASGRVRY